VFEAKPVLIAKEACRSYTLVVSKKKASRRRVRRGKVVG
jgi:hypothetical protein